MTLYHSLVSRIKQHLSNWTEEKKLFFLSFVFLIIISFATNNKIFVLFSLIYISGLYHVLKNWIKSFVYAYIFLLIFQNGKGIEYLLVPGEFVYENIPFFMTVNLTMPGILTIILIYIYLRNRKKTWDKETQKRITLSDISIIIFILANIIASAFSNIPSLSFLLTLQLIGYVFIFYFIRQNHLKQWISTIFIPLISSLSIFNGALSILQYFSIISPGYISSTPSDTDLHTASENVLFMRAQGVFSHPNFLGYFMAIFIPILFYASLSKYTTKFTKLISAVGFLSGLAGLILSGSRASWVIFTISMILILRIQTIRISLKITLMVKRIFLYCFALCIITIPTYVIPRLSQLAITLNSGGGAGFRFDLIVKSFLVTLQYPLGIGLGIFPQILLIDIGGFTSTPTQPHNLFAQILVSSGFVGLFAISTFLFLQIKSSLKIFRKETEYQRILRSIFVISLGCYLLLSMFYPILTEQQIFGWLWVLLFLIV